MIGNSERISDKIQQQPQSCSVVIRAYNEDKHIGRLLNGISKQSLKDVEIILVDSGSTDSTIEIASRYPVNIVHISPSEFTFGRSINLGISEAVGEYIVIASAHIYPVYPDWLENLLVPFIDSDVALTYGKQSGNEKTKFSEKQVFSQWFPEQSELNQEHPFCNNANAAIRRSLWERHHYDERLSGLEDLEWARWALEQKMKISYVSEAEVYHVHNEPPKEVFNRYRREAIAFKRLFPNEKFHFGDFTRLVTSNIVSDIWHAIRQGESLKAMPSILWFRYMQFWGTLKGYQHSGPITEKLRRTFYYPRRINSDTRKEVRNVEPIQYND